ncbi:transposase IS4 [Nitzschia inconspicua]|uniref:Transposase IS4 n=1 Tax=Nitzschia inconspicua TaxID=303405 RepID=A0A9K3LPA7_9STRA|nr:transposase IS4 [Nitzschia inconspicua]
MGVLVYTGKYTSSDTRPESTKKTVQVVQQLCKPLRGSHRTVYVDRFYSSVDLLKQLGDIHLYTKGRVLSNRIPRSMTIAKRSREFKTLNRGDAVNNVLTYITTKGTSNALVQYNKATNGKQEPYNIVDFKNKVIEALVGPLLRDDIPSEQSVAHCMTNISCAERQRCTYCSLRGKVARTRYMCKGCGVPYCCIGSGKTDKDCFASAHENGGNREICIQHYRMQQTNTRKNLLKKRK